MKLHSELQSGRTTTGKRRSLWRGLRKLGYLIGVLATIESYYLGTNLGVAYFRNPQIPNHSFLLGF